MKFIKYFLLLSLLINNSIFANFPMEWQISFQNASTDVMHNIIWLHKILMIILSLIVAFVIFLLVYVIWNFNAKSNPIPSKCSSNVMLEIIWTLIPVVMLILIAIPSFKILHYAEYTPKSDLTVKVVGYQWYWHYSYPDYDNIEFDSYMIQDSDLKPGQKRLLEVDNRVVIPIGKVVKFLTTSADVIHSFAVPSFGIKIDAVPGRTNETWVKVDKLGVYYGQCSELCGVNHGFMPIAVEVVSDEDFTKWIQSKKKK